MGNKNDNGVNKNDNGVNKNAACYHNAIAKL